MFSLPGIGKLIVNGAANRDYTLVLGLGRVGDRDRRDLEPAGRPGLRLA